MSRGRRVLTVAMRPLSAAEAARALTSRPDRHGVEAGLTFMGFLIYDCDLKADSKGVIR
jgi:magnesium-transporting ATPase (P-type)